MRELFGPDSLPAGWLAYLQEVDQIREERGCSHPIDLIMGVFFVLVENPQITQKLAVSKIELLPNGSGLDVRDADLVVSTVNAVLGDPVARQALTDVLAICLPDGLSGWSGHNRIVQLVDKLVPRDGIFLNLCCGTGYHTASLAKRISPAVIGLDRQYHPLWYQIWRERPNGTSFTRADARFLPFSDNSLDVVLFEAAVRYQNPKAVRLSVLEAARVLKPNCGLLIVGPQCEDRWSGSDQYHYYQKVQGGDKGYFFQRTTWRRLMKS